MSMIKGTNGETYELLGSRKVSPSGVRPSKAYYAIIAKDNQGLSIMLDPSEVGLTQDQARNEIKHI